MTVRTDATTSRWHDLLARHRVHAAVRQGRRHDREVARRDHDGALAEVEVDLGVDVVVEHPPTA